MHRLGLAAALLLGCTGDDGTSPDICVELSESCDPLYEPTFDEIHTNTLSTSCALSSCHDVTSARSGLVLEDPDQAYAALVDDRIVVPGDPECSVLQVRLEGTGPLSVMPPGAPLDAAERCSIRQWIEDGAPR